MRFMDLVQVIYSHDANFTYDSKTGVLSAINYTKSELRSKSLAELEVIYRGYCND